MKFKALVIMMIFSINSYAIESCPIKSAKGNQNKSCEKSGLKSFIDKVQVEIDHLAEIVKEHVEPTKAEQSASKDDKK